MSVSILLTCIIITVADGDTMKASCDDHQVTIRLAEIDAPEKKQAFGLKSKQSLSDLCLGKNVQIVEQTRDRYNRIVARVNCAGTDANSEQVRRGMAWVFDRYVNDHNLYKLEDNARSNRTGLWTDPSPIPPWEWRKTTKK